MLWERRSCLLYGVGFYTSEHLCLPKSWGHNCWQAGHASSHAICIEKGSRHHILYMACSFQPLDHWTFSSFCLQYSWLAFSVAGRFSFFSVQTVTSSAEPALTTLFQMACPYYPSAFLATIICKGLVNMLVYMFRICALLYRQWALWGQGSTLTVELLKPVWCPAQRTAC